MFDALPNLHPFFIHFPIALFVTGLTADVALLVGYRAAWLDRAVVLLFAAATVLSAAAAYSGKLAENGIERALTPGAQEQLGQHSDWAFFTVVLLCLALGLRFDALWRDRSEAAPRLGRGRAVALAAALAACASLLTTAGHGGALVYRHAVGVDIEAAERP